MDLPFDGAISRYFTEKAPKEVRSPFVSFASFVAFVIQELSSAASKRQATQLVQKVR